MAEPIVFQRPPVGTTKQTFSKIVAGATMAYQLHNRDPKNKDGYRKTLPPVERIVQFSGVTAATVGKVISTQEFLYAMRERGIFWDARTNLTPEQVYTIGIMTDPSSKRDMAGKLKQAGITMQTYRMWLKQPQFAMAIQQIGEDMLGEHIADVNTAVVRNAIDGNMKAVEIYHQMTGRFNQENQEIKDLQRLTSLLLETIFRYITDTATLSRITQDFEKIMQGKAPAAELLVDGQIVNEYQAISPAPMVYNSGDTNDLGDNSDSTEGLVDEIPDGFFDFADEKDFDI